MSIVNVRTVYASLASAHDRSALTIAMCERNVLDLPREGEEPVTNGTRNNRSAYVGEAKHEDEGEAAALVSSSNSIAPLVTRESWNSWRRCETDVCAVLAYFVVTTYFELDTAVLVVRYILRALKHDIRRWHLFSPTRGCLLIRSVARSLLAEDALKSLFLSNGIIDYLELLDIAAARDPEGFLRQLSMDDHALDMTALHALLLLTGRIAQVFPELSFCLAKPMVSYPQRIITSLLKDTMVSAFLSRYASPSPIRMLIENLHFIPRHSKGVRLLVARSIIHTLVAVAGTEASSSPSTSGKRWMEHFSLSEGPYQVYFAVMEWCTMREEVTTIREQASDDRPATLLALLHEFDHVLYDMICLLLALPDDGGPFHSELYAYLKSIAEMSTYTSHGDSSTQLEDSMLPSFSTSEGTRVLGDYGFRVLIRAATDASKCRPSLGFLLSRLTAVVVRLFSSTIVSKGLVSQDLCNIFEHLLFPSPPPPAAEQQRQRKQHQELDPREGEQDSSKGEGDGIPAVTPPMPTSSDYHLVISQDTEHNNESQFFVLTVMELYRQCCISKIHLERQEDGAEGIAKLANALLTSKLPLICCTATKTVLFRSATHSDLVLLYETLVSNDLVKTIASEIVVDSSTAVSTSCRRREYMLRLVQDIIVKCPHLQAPLIPYSTNFVQLIRDAALQATSHVLMRDSSEILSSLLLTSGDRTGIVCTSLLGMVSSIRIADPRSWISGCWAMQTVVRLLAREKDAQCFFRDHRGELFLVLANLCPELQRLRLLFDGDCCAAYALCNAFTRHRRAIAILNAELRKPAEADSVQSPHKPEGGDANGSHSSFTLLGFTDSSHANDSHEDVSNNSTTCHRHIVRYEIGCDLLILLLHGLNLIHCLQPKNVADDSIASLVRCLGAGPMLQCRLYTSIVTRALIGMSSFANVHVFTEIHNHGKVSLLSTPPGGAASPSSASTVHADISFSSSSRNGTTTPMRVSLQDLAGGWDIRPSAGDRLFDVHHQRVIRPQFIRVLLELMSSASAPTDGATAFELVVSVVELVYHSFHQRMENLYVLSSCGVWDVAVSQLVRIATVAPQLRTACAQAISSCMRLFGLHGLNLQPVTAHLLLCFDQTSRQLDPEDAQKALSTWDWLFCNALPCRVPQSFISFPFGCLLHTKQRLTHPLMQAKREMGHQGGVDVAVQYDVWKQSTDSHVTVASWIMMDMSMYHEGDVIFFSLHFDRNRVVVELGSDERGNVFVGVHNRNMGEMRSKRVLLGKLPQLPHKQWTLLYLTMENLAAKSQTSLRSKFTIRFTVGIHTMSGNHQYSESVVATPDVEVYQSLREKSLGSCTTLTHITLGATRKRSAPSSMSGDGDKTSPTASTFVPQSSYFDGGDGVQSPGSPGSPGSPFRSTRSTKNASGATTPITKIAHQMFFGSLAVFMGELKPFESLILFTLGSDALAAADFLDRNVIINQYPVLARLVGEHQRFSDYQALSVLASMWLRRHEGNHDAPPPSFSGAFPPFPHVQREKLVCVLGANQGELCIWTRRETVTQVSMSEAGSSVLSNASIAVGTTNAATIAIGDMVPASMALIVERRGSNVASSGASASENPSSQMTAATVLSLNASVTTDFVFLPRQKPLVLVPLEVALLEDGLGSLLNQSSPPAAASASASSAATLGLGSSSNVATENMRIAVSAIIEKPLQHSICATYALWESFGGLSTFLWIANLLESNSPSQVNVIQCACSWLSLHVDRPLFDGWNTEASKMQELTLLSVMLHSQRIDVNESIAKCITMCAGYPLLSRLDVIPLLLDFSLWARDPEAMNIVTNYLCDLQLSTNPFARFNRELLRRRRTGDASYHHILEELLLHLHMKLSSASTRVEWHGSTIPGVRSLVSLLCVDFSALNRIAASAAWLSSQDECDPAWVLCLLDAAIAAVHDKALRQQEKRSVALEEEIVNSGLPQNVIAILKCGHDEIRLRGLKLFLFLPNYYGIITAAIAQYEARSLCFGPKRCITPAELHLLMSRVAGGDTWVASESLRLVVSAHQEMSTSDVTRPIVFFLTALIPYVPESQQMPIIAFISDMMQRSSMLLQGMTSNVFYPPVLEDPFTSYVLYALAETFERADRALEIGSGTAIRGLVEILVDVCVARVSAMNSSGFVGVVDTISTILYTMFNVFVEDDEIGVRSPTPLFHCARVHMLNLCCACIHAFDAKIDVASNPMYIEEMSKLFDLVADITCLLYIPSSFSSGDDMASPGGAIPVHERSRSASTTSGLGGGHTVYCSFFARHQLTNRSLRVRKPLVTINGAEVASHISRDNIELVPIYALQCACKVYFKIKAGASPASFHMEKSVTNRICSSIQAMQTKLITFLLTIEAPRGFDAALDELQTLALLHVWFMGSSMFGLQVGGSVDAKKKPKKVVLLKVPSTAKWNEGMLELVEDSLVVSSIVRSKEAAIALLRCSLRFMADIDEISNEDESGSPTMNRSRSQDGGATTTTAALKIQRANLCLNMCRCIVYHTNTAVSKKDFVDLPWSAFEVILNGFPSITAVMQDRQKVTALVRLSGQQQQQPSVLFAPQCAAQLDKYVSGMINGAVTRALQNLRVRSSHIAELEPQKALESRKAMDGALQRLQASTLKRATFYERCMDQEATVILASNAAYRFALLPWWGLLSALTTDQPVPLNQWELDRFMGPDWERARLRRFAHTPKMMGPSDPSVHTARYFAPLLVGEAPRLHITLDDVELLSMFGVTAVPQSLNQRVLQSDAMSGIRCRMILPMDRVPVLVSVSPLALSIQVDFPKQRSLNNIPEEATGSGSGGGGRRRMASATMAHHSNAQQESNRERTKGLRYHHEVPVELRVVPLSSIRAVWPRRNLLQHVAFELLLESGESVFLSFDTHQDRKTIMERISIFAKQHLDKTLVINESNLKLWRSWWNDGRISNFKYLMFLNFASGRSYGDMRQYPVFPHVIADYTSRQLDLKNVATFRLLDKPMGAQSPEREEKVVAKYEEIASLGMSGVSLSDFHQATNFGIGGGGGTPGVVAFNGDVDFDMMPLHYGSHYSPPGGALHFLVRVQPFADYFLDMNSKLDDADRVFESMAKAYSICSTGKDVKEMVPEFYCLVEMFRNLNQVPFGTKQDGVVVDDVLLPPWGPDPRSFVVLMREALECRFVSERLHAWIDLIFGHKQRGREAVLAVNVFHPLTYEGVVDLSTVEDEVKLKSHTTQIDSFGQTPMQLFPKAAQKPRCKPTSDFFATPCPTLRFDNAFARSCVLLFPEKLQPIPTANTNMVTSGGGGNNAGSNASNSSSTAGGDRSWISFCRSPMNNAALGADELGEWLLSTSVTARSVYHVLPVNVIPFTVVADQPKDYILVRTHMISIVDTKDLTRDLATLRCTKALNTVAAVAPPFVYVGTSAGAIAVVEVRCNEDVIDIEIPAQSVTTSSGASGQQQPGSRLSNSGLGGNIQNTATSSSAFAQHSDGALAADLGREDMSFLSSVELKTTRTKQPVLIMKDVLFGHHGAIVALTVSQEWGVLVSAGQDWIIGVWDMHRRLLLRTIPGPQLVASHPQLLLHEQLLSTRSFFPQVVAINPLRGDICVGGLKQQDDRYHGELRVFTVNGDLCAVALWKFPPTAMIACGPVLFVAEGRNVVVLNSVTLERRHELSHPNLEESVVSLALNPYGTCLAAVDKNGAAGSWRVGPA